MMKTNEILEQIRVIVDKFPLEELLTIAEAVAMLLKPAGPIIVAIIKVLIQVRPAVSSMAQKTEEIMALPEEDQIKARQLTFSRMFDMAIADNTISNEEKAFLMPKALAAGISVEEFECMCVTMQNPYHVKVSNV